MNKQNIGRNISVLLYKKSPLLAKQSATPLSFRNLNTKSFYKNESKGEGNVSPLSVKRNKTITNRIDTSVIHTEPSESIISNHQAGSSLMQAFKLERESLTNTLKMYKQQVEMLNQENSKLKKQASKYRNQIKDRDEETKMKEEKSSELSKKVVEYENMLPKLIELEQLQEKVIHQNGLLKNKIKLQEGLLTNVANLAKSEDSAVSILQKIRSLTQPFLPIHTSTRNLRKEK